VVIGCVKVFRNLDMLLCGQFHHLFSTDRPTPEVQESFIGSRD
jgi:hypothetical protein